MTPSLPDSMLNDVLDLTVACLNGEADAASVGRLNDILLADKAARRNYLLAIHDSLNLRRWAIGEEENADVLENASDLDAALLQPSGWEADEQSCQAVPASSKVPPILISPDHNNHGAPLNTFMAWSQAYLVATVFLAIGLVIGLAVRTSIWRPGDVAGNNVPPGQLAPTVVEKAVGRVTDLADCRGRQFSVASGLWSNIPNHESEIINSKLSVGDRLVLSAGLMEVTYDTGAKVLLEGPCTYNIDSECSGYLAVGKLTALVEEKAAESNPQPLIPNPLFAIRTPTAVVTDLGTEFGVEVEQSGATRSHVFQGSVEMRVSNGRKSTAFDVPVEILRAGESARIERGRNSRYAITRESGQSKRFIRQIRGGQAKKQFGKELAQLEQDPFSNCNSRFCYRLIDLGALGGPTSQAGAINAMGQVVGSADDANGIQHAFLYFNGEMQKLRVYPDSVSSAVDINDSGQVIGSCGSDFNNRFAFLYSNGKTIKLGSLGGPSASAYAVNNSGHVVGASLNARGVRRAFLYTVHKGMQDLGALGGPEASSCAMDINAAGQVAGYSQHRRGGSRAFLYTPDAGMEDLGVLKGDDISLAFSVNEAGRVAGFSLNTKGQRQIFVCGNGLEMKSLCTFSGSSTFILAINNVGQIVGSAKLSARETTGGVQLVRSFLYSGGSMYSLMDLVDASSVGWTNLEAKDINDSGQIIGVGIAPDGNTRAIMLTPIKGQEPWE